jgi:hypothetical protein
LLAKGLVVRPMGMKRFLAAVFVLSLAGVGAAQSSMPPNQGTPFKDTSVFKTPPGAKVAIVEFEDLECPACAHAYPVVHQAMEQYHIPLMRYDFPLKMHIWSHDAAIIARYLQDMVSPAVADEYRKDVFAHQYMISSKDDMHNFTQKFFADHKLEYPFVLDPTGRFQREVDADYALGEKEGLNHTPTIVVVTDHKGWIEVVNVDQLYAAIDTAEAAVANEHEPSARHKR